MYLLLILHIYYACSFELATSFAQLRAYTLLTIDSEEASVCVTELKHVEFLEKYLPYKQKFTIKQLK